MPKSACHHACLRHYPQYAAELRPLLRQFNAKLLRQWGKDYLLFPVLALLLGANALAVLAGNLLANLLRNLWTFAVIFCGHFTEKAAVFSKESVLGGKPVVIGTCANCVVPATCPVGRCCIS